MAVETTHPRRRLLTSEARNTLLLLAFASPWLIGFVAFVLYPVAASAYYSRRKALAPSTRAAS